MSWKDWYINKRREKFTIDPLLESENLTLTLEEAQRVIKEFGGNENLSEYDTSLLDKAQSIVYDARRSSSKQKIGEVDPGIINDLYSFLSELNPNNKEEVVQAQQALGSYGYYTSKIDSTYGGDTELAIQEFKEDVSGNPRYTIDWILEQAKDLFDIFD